MPDQTFFAEIRQILEQANISVEHYGGLLGQVQQLIMDNFGENGLYAAYIGTAAVGILLLWKLIKLSFSALKYLVVPAVGLALLGSVFMPYSFSTLLPVTVTGCSLFLLFKG